MTALVFAEAISWLSRNLNDQNSLSLLGLSPGYFATSVLQSFQKLQDPL
jgi:hypothetical protein